MQAYRPAFFIHLAFFLKLNNIRLYMKQKIIFGILVSVMGFSNKSMASVGQPGFALSTAYWTWVIESENSVFNAGRNSISTSLMISKLNYALPSGFFFGATMFNSKDSVSSNKLFGPNLGFNFKGLSLGLTYFLNPKEQNNETVEYTDGQFLSLELGYHVNVTKYFVIGADLIYLKRNYKTAIVNGAETNGTIKSDQYYPLLSIGFVFDPGSDSGYLEDSF